VKDISGSLTSFYLSLFALLKKTLVCSHDRFKTLSYTSHAKNVSFPLLDGVNSGLVCHFLMEVVYPLSFIFTHTLTE
jgi:hypothetical protein